MSIDCSQADAHGQKNGRKRRFKEAWKYPVRMLVLEGEDLTGSVIDNLALVPGVRMQIDRMVDTLSEVLGVIEDTPYSRANHARPVTRCKAKRRADITSALELFEIPDASV